MPTLYWIASSASSWATAANWSTGSVPVSGDTVIFNHNGVGSVTSGLATGIGSGAGSESLTIIIEKGYTGSIGAVAATGVATYLTFSATLEVLELYVGQTSGDGSPSGSPRILIDTTNVTSTACFVYDTASAGSETYYPPLLLKGPAISLYQFGGKVGVSARPDETATLTRARITEASGAVRPELYLGRGCTCSELDASTGYVYSRTAETFPAVDIYGDAQMEVEGGAAFTALSIDDESVFTQRNGALISTLNLSGTYRRRGPSVLTVTNTNLYEGYVLDIDNGVAGGNVTFTNQPAHVRCSYQDGQIIAPKGVFI
jgi:hypothetical protein